LPAINQGSLPRGGHSQVKLSAMEESYQEKGLDGLKNIPPIPRHRPHRKTDEERQKVLECASIHTHLSSRSLAPCLWDEYQMPISPKTIYNILRAHGWSDIGNRE